MRHLHTLSAKYLLVRPVQRVLQAQAKPACAVAGCCQSNGMQAYLPLRAAHCMIAAKTDFHEPADLCCVPLSSPLTSNNRSIKTYAQLCSGMAQQNMKPVHRLMWLKGQQSLKSLSSASSEKKTLSVASGLSSCNNDIVPPCSRYKLQAAALHSQRCQKQQQ